MLESDHLIFMVMWQGDVFGPGLFFHPRNDPVFFVHIIQLTLSWIFFLEKFGPEIFFSVNPPQTKQKKLTGSSLRVGVVFVWTHILEYVTAKPHPKV